MFSWLVMDGRANRFQDLSNKAQLREPTLAPSSGAFNSVLLLCAWTYVSMREYFGHTFCFVNLVNLPDCVPGWPCKAFSPCYCSFRMLLRRLPVHVQLDPL